MDIQAKAKELAERANRCCHRNDGYEEDLASAIEAALREAAGAASTLLPVVIDPSVPPSEVRFIDPRSGSVQGRIVNVCEPTSGESRFRKSKPAE